MPFFEPYYVYLTEEHGFVDYMSAFAPTVAAFIAVAVAVWQGIIQNKQHNLALFEKRWDFWKNTQIIGRKAQLCHHATYEEIANDESKNHWLVYNDIIELSKKGEILFGKQVKNALTELAELFKKKHEKLEEHLQTMKYHKECPENYDLNKGMKAFKESNAIAFEASGKWDDLAVLIFEKIRELKV